jgi:hypothetical protein
VIRTRDVTFNKSAFFTSDNDQPRQAELKAIIHLIELPDIQSEASASESSESEHDQDAEEASNSLNITVPTTNATAPSQDSQNAYPSPISMTSSTSDKHKRKYRTNQHLHESNIITGSKRRRLSSNAVSHY